MKTSKPVSGCFKKWKVILEDQVLKFFEKLGLLSEVEAWKKELEDELNGDPKAIFKLLKEPIIYEVGGIKRRRYRLYLRGQPFRLVFVINTSSCVVIFTKVAKRDEETYRKLKRD